MTLKAWAKTALWAGGGAYVGVFVGSVLLDAETAIFWMVPWSLVFLVYVSGIAYFGRDKGAVKLPPLPEDIVSVPQHARAASAAASATPRPAPRGALQVTLEFPDIPADYPPVAGVDDSILVLVTVHGPRDSAAVRLVAQLRDNASRFVAGEGVTGLDGTVVFHVKAPGTGELVLEAEAREGEHEGRATTSLSIVRYSEEIERLFREFRAYAQSALGPGSEADTARELADKLREGAPSSTAKALLELARVYELVAYGEREADRTLYLSLVHALLVLERDSASAAPEPGHASATAEG